MYVPVATLSTENYKKLLEQLKSGFKRTVKWNNYSSQMTIQPQNNSLNYLIDPTFTNVNGLSVLSIARNAKVDHRDSFSHYYVPNIEIKDFNVLIDGNSFLKDPQQSNFIGTLEGQNDGATIFFITEKSEETTFEFLQNSVNIL